MNTHLNGLSAKLGFAAEDHVDFRTLIYTLWENKRVVFVTCAVFTLLAALYTIFAAPEYEANALVKVESKNHGNANNLSQQLNINLADADVAVAQIALIRSRVILDPVIENLGLNIDVTPRRFPLLGYLFAKKNREQFVVKHLMAPSAYNKTLRLISIDDSHYHLTDVHNQTLLEGEVGKLITNNAGYAIQVTEMPSRPGVVFELARKSNGGVIKDILSRLQLEELGDSHNNKTGILQISLRDTNPIRLAKVLNAIIQIAQEKDGERKAMETAKTIEFLNQQIPLVRSSLEQAEHNLNSYRASHGKLDIKIETHQLLEQLHAVNTQMSKAQLNKANLLQQFTPKHPFIIEINDRLKQLGILKQAIEKQIKSYPASDQIAIDLMRDVKVQNDLYLILLNKIEELRLIKAGTLSDVRILASATPPDEPIPKYPGIVLAASLLLGFICGCLVVLIGKAFYSYVNDPHSIERDLNITSLAIVPYSERQAKIMRSYKTKKTGYLDVLARCYPRDLSIEALRSLRTSLHLMIESGDSKIITIMGISQSIGKSFLSANFSCLLAELNKRVLLIDGDIRKGHLNLYFNGQRAPGLCEVLRGTATLEDAITPTAIDSLYFLPCGNYPQNPAELLMHPNLKSLMSTVSGQFDLIIIDTSPILAVTDSAIIGALAGLNLLVIGGDRHQKEEIKHALKRLESAGVKVHGTIFNNLKPGSAAYYRYNYNYNYS